METSKVFIITGRQGEGKTTFLTSVLTELSLGGIKAAGFCADGQWRDNLRTKFEIVDINGTGRRLLCCDEAVKGFEKVGRFYFNPKTIQWGEDFLSTAKDNEQRIYVMDEIGKFELAQKVWYNAFHKLLTEKYPVLFTVRKEILEQVIEYFHIFEPIIFGLDDTQKKVAQTIAVQL